MSLYPLIRRIQNARMTLGDLTVIWTDGKGQLCLLANATFFVVFSGIIQNLGDFVSGINEILTLR